MPGIYDAHSTAAENEIDAIARILIELYYFYVRSQYPEVSRKGTLYLDYSLCSALKKGK